MLDVLSPYPSLMDQPDSDAIEMFCGQIPRSMTEKDLRVFFENYGRIYKLNILRDKQTGESKGCCFITYYTRKAALHAQNALHNLMVLPGMHHAIQMKPADVENRNERKIFIGMISKSSNENDIRQLFLPFGAIEECTVLRDLNHRSRGCAFVTYQKRQSALNAIRAVHHSCTMDGCSSPINVRFADSPKDKETRKMQQKLNENLLQHIKTNSTAIANETDENFNSLNLMLFNQLYSNALTCLNTAPSSYANENDLSCGDNSTTNPYALSNLLTTKLTTDRSSQLFPLLSPFTAEWQNHGTVGYQAHTSPVNELIGETTDSPVLYGEGQPAKQHILNSKDGFSTATNLNLNCEINSRLWPASTDDDLRLLDALLSPNVNGVSATNSNPKQANNDGSQLNHPNDDKQMIGPAGSNLFIYHLPAEFTDHDLAQTFSPFGNVLSAKVFIDKLTDRSKCFGFVSYDNIYSAHQAIEQMNGFQIGFKRLKVQLKKTFIS